MISDFEIKINEFINALQEAKEAALNQDEQDEFYEIVIADFNQRYPKNDWLGVYAGLVQTLKI